MHSRLGTRLGNDASGPPHSRRTTTAGRGRGRGAEVVAVHLTRGLPPPESGGNSGPEGQGRAGRGRGGRDPGGARLAELRHTAGRRLAGRSAGRQHLFSRGGAAKGVASYPLSEAQRRAACTWLLDEGGRHRRPSRAGAGGYPACAGGYPACARRASRGAVRAPSATEWSWAGNMPMRARGVICSKSDVRLRTARVSNTQ